MSSGLVWCSMPCGGVAWCGVVLCGVVWCCGVSCLVSPSFVRWVVCLLIFVKKTETHST